MNCVATKNPSGRAWILEVDRKPEDFSGRSRKGLRNSEFRRLVPYRVCTAHYQRHLFLPLKSYFTGGAKLLSIYNNSLSSGLQTLYPDFPWNLSKFSGDLESQWEDPEAAKRFLKFIEKKLGISKPRTCFGSRSCQHLQAIGI